MVRSLTIKNIFKIHFFFYVIALIAFLTGLFKEFVIFTSIIMIHEIGHIIGAIICKWKIEKIILLPFGGLTIFNEPVNSSLCKELLIVLLGPIFQCFFFYFVGRGNYIFTNTHYAILIFNLLPIYPLDGSKILNILSNTIFSFKTSNALNIIISYIVIIIVIFIGLIKHMNILFILIIIFLLKKVIEEQTNLDNIFNKFLLERYLYNFNFKMTKKIKRLKQMQKSKNHIFHINNKLYSEKIILKKYFDINH